jgi:hypothetical protein
MRHTLATRAINRGMSLKAIGALLSGTTAWTWPCVTRTLPTGPVADVYFADTDKVAREAPNKI